MKLGLASLIPIRLIMLTLALSGCRHQDNATGYRLLNYDGTTKLWTVERTVYVQGQLQHQRLLVSCVSHIRRPEATIEPICNLDMGRLYPLNPKVESWQNNERLFIGDESDYQVFAIHKDEVEQGKP